MAKRNYLLVNVPAKKHGYTFCVCTEYTENEAEEVINACKAKDLFNDEEDAFYADVVEADENDLKYFGTEVIDL